MIGVLTSEAPLKKVRSRLFNVQDKIKIVNRVHNGETKAEVARNVGVPESTLRGWCKAREKLLTLYKMEVSGEYIPTTSSSNNSRNNWPYSSRSTPTDQNKITKMKSVSGAVGKASEKHVLGPVPKPAKLNKKSADATFNMSDILVYSSSRGIDQLYRPHHNFPANDRTIKNTALLNSYNPFSFSFGHSSSMSFLTNDLYRNNDTIGSLTTSTSNMLFNDNGAPITTSMLKIPKVLSEKENTQPSNTEKPIDFSIPRLTNNQILSPTSRNVVATCSKSSKGSKLTALITRLNRAAAMPMSNTEEKIISNNTVNDNNVDHVNNMTRNQSSSEFLSESSAALSNCTKLSEWLEKYGLSVFNIQQIEQVRTTLDILTNLLKEIESKNETNGHEPAEAT